MMSYNGHELLIIMLWENNSHCKQIASQNLLGRSIVTFISKTSLQHRSTYLVGLQARGNFRPVNTFMSTTQFPKLRVLS